jgi:hypothetical protein
MAACRRVDAGAADRCFFAVVGDQPRFTADPGAAF